MDWIDALIMGLVQGLAEYLPISSSGHLEICREILGLNLAGEEALGFDVALHVATVLSTIVVLWKEFVPLCKSFFTVTIDNNFWYVCKILVSCIPVAIVGLCFKDVVESFFGSGLSVVGCIPILGEALLDIHKMISGTSATLESVGTLPLIVGFIASFVVGCIACKWMIEIVKKGKLVWFAVYCAAAGALCLIW